LGACWWLGYLLSSGVFIGDSFVQCEGMFIVDTINNSDRHLLDFGMKKKRLFSV